MSEPDCHDVKLLHEWFLDGLAAAPEGIALRINDRTWTYAELHRAACDWAGTLIAACGRAPQRVGIIASKTPEAYLGFLAALYAGGTAVPLSPEYPVERNRAVAAAAGLDALVVDRHGAAQFRDISAVTPLRICLTASADGLASVPGPPVVTPDGSESAEPVRDGADRLAYILFTSGSTGYPKGVPVRHGNISAFLHAVLPRYSLGPQDVFSQVYELTFDLSMFEVWAAWASGACLTVLNRVQALAPERFAARRGITFWTSTPSLAGAVRARGEVRPGSLPGLRYTMFCGEPLPAETARHWSLLAPNATIDNLYGPTELAVACTGHRWDPAGAGAAGAGGSVPIGRPFPGVRHVLLDDDGEVSGTAGEFCVTGEQRFDGYLDAANDEGRFIELAGERWYRTGDRVRWDGAGLVHLGRMDGQVKVQGYRIEVGDVEEAVRRAAPQLDAAVFAVPAPSGTVLAGFVLGCTALDTTGLLKRMADHLPPYMLPRHLWPLADAPLSRNGKVDREALRKEALRRLAERADSSGTSDT
ncbi:AMP-binding protein [Streptomyces albidoflavus]|uniref:AMP-binding protein n=1 Tax=Streptomyces albidoflavus TaxID=1886 RepID=UPI0033E326E7